MSSSHTYPSTKKGGCPPRAAAPIRVAALIDTVDVSGPGRQLAALARRLAATGVELHVIMFQRAGRPRAPFAEYLAAAGVPHTVLPESGPLDVRLVGRLRRALVELAPDVVQTHSYRTTVLAYALRRLGWRCPWVAFFHGATFENLKIRLYNWLDRRLLVRADHLVVMSERHRAGFAGARVSVIYNAVVPLPESGAAVSIDRWPESAGMRTPVLGVIGRLSPEKGVDVFLYACRELVARGVVFGAVVAGEGPERARLEALRDALGLGARVRFLGSVAAIRSLYPQLDLLVIPSRSEGLPNVLLEALAADVPAVATRVGAIPELLEGSAAGLLVPPGAPDALADAIERGLTLKTDEASRRARRVLTERSSLDGRASAHLRLYHQLLQGRAP